jgi:hypothetical protein
MRAVWSELVECPPSFFSLRMTIKLSVDNVQKASFASGRRAASPAQLNEL